MKQRPRIKKESILVAKTDGKRFKKTKAGKEFAKKSKSNRNKKKKDRQLAAERALKELIRAQDAPTTKSITS